ncbi:MAG TPA: NAD(P)H-hydrate epimerase, partial [Spirochaetota bacterium]|nr:NAD(P)H-hydrate epimerase [Spirochaetota bacterium]
MKVATALQMQEIDRLTINEYGIPGEVLMAVAGKSVADYIKTYLCADNIAVLCGVGNNGGDGYVAAYFLSQYIK